MKLWRGEDDDFDRDTSDRETIGVTILVIVVLLVGAFVLRAIYG